MVGIYKITNPRGKVYIGQSIDIEDRWKDYKYVFRKKTKVYLSLQKYGVKDHKFDVIELCSIELLNVKETFWKQHYLNKVNGDWNKVLFHELYDLGGGPKSEETKLKLSKASKGKPKPIGFGDSIGTSIIQYSLEGNFIKEWESIAKAKLQFKGDIPGNCGGKQKTAGGYIWKYKTDNYPLVIEVNLVNGNKGKKRSLV